MSEEWRDIEGYEGLYQVSDIGRVRSLPKVKMSRHGTPWAKLLPERIMKLHVKKSSGYIGVRLSKDGVKKNYKVHVLVCAAFHGPRPDGKQVAHLDGSRTNNHKDNLRWKTPVENQSDRLAHGTCLYGEIHPRAKLSNATVIDLRKGRITGRSMAAIAKDLGVCATTVHNILHEKSWAHL